MKSTIYGVGINDAGYRVQEWESIGYVDGERKQKTIWRCPFYATWTSMLQRCYSDNFHKKNPTYIGCSISEDWKRFSNFREWMEKQDWEGKQLDKDLLDVGNKVYSEDMCVFVSKNINMFLTDRGNDRGEWPLGVYWKKASGKFAARCCNPFTKKQEYLGYLTCPEEAHKVWGERKYELAVLLAAEQTDERVAKALISRYSQFKLNGEKI